MKIPRRMSLRWKKSQNTSRISSSRTFFFLPATVAWIFNETGCESARKMNWNAICAFCAVTVELPAANRFTTRRRERNSFFLRTRDFRILREDCFWDKLKEVIEVDVARRRRGRKNQNTRKPRRKKEKIGKRKLTIEVFGENIAKWTEKSCRTGNFIANADIVYCIYWPSLAFIFLPRVDLLNYFDCLSVELGCALWRKEIIILRGKIAQVALENWLFSFVEAWSCLMLLKKLTHLSLQQNGSSRYRLKKGERDSLDLWFLL